MPVQLGESLAAGQAERLFLLPERGPLVVVNYHYDVIADGRRFLLGEPTGPMPPSRIRVVQNWLADFKDRR